MPYINKMDQIVAVVMVITTLHAWYVLNEFLIELLRTYPWPATKALADGYSLTNIS
jgi:hypothetical protein